MMNAGGSSIGRYSSRSWIYQNGRLTIIRLSWGNGRLPLGLLANPASLFAQIVRGSQSGDRRRIDEYTRISIRYYLVSKLHLSPLASRNTSCPEARQFEQGTSRFLFHLSSTDANDALLIRPLYLHIFSRALTSFSALPPPFLPRALSSTQNLSRKPLPTPSSLLHAHPWLHFEARETMESFLISDGNCDLVRKFQANPDDGSVAIQRRLSTPAPLPR